MQQISAGIVEEEDELYIEIDGVQTVTAESVSTASEHDCFSTVNINKVSSKKVKRRYASLKKRFDGKDGTHAKYEDPDAASGYGVFDVVEPPYNIELLASLFEENPIHNAAVSARVANTVGLGFEWADSKKAKKMIEDASGKEDSAKRVRTKLDKEAEKLEVLFEEFNSEDTFTDILTKVWIDVLTTGNGYIEVGRNLRGEIGYVGHVPSYLVRVRRKRDGFVQRAQNQFIFFRNFQDQETSNPVAEDQNPNEIIHLKLYTPTNNYYGVPPIVSAMSAIIGDKYAKEYNIDFFENKSIPRYAIILKGAKLSNKSKQEFINYFKNEVKGNNHGTLVIPLPAVLGKDVDIKFEKLENTIQDASFDKYRKSNRDDIIIADRVPAPKIGIYDDANLAVARDADKTFKMQVVGPDQQGLEMRVNRIVKEFSELKQFKFSEIDIIDEDLRSRIHDRYLRTEVISPNEVRTMLGLTPREGGDKILPYPTNVKKEQTGQGGQPGNANSAAGSPPKSQQDSGVKESTSNVDTGTNAQKGENQDKGGVK